MEDARLLEKTVEQKVVLEGGYLTVRVDTIEDAEGRRHQRELVIHPGAVAILAIDRGDVLMVRQFRTPWDGSCSRFPRARSTAGRTARSRTRSLPRRASSARRPASPRPWRKIGRFFTAPGFASEDMHLYVATDLSPIPGYAGPETDERLDLRRVPWREAVQLAENGTIEDAKSICGLFWLDRLVSRGEISL